MDIKLAGSIAEFAYDPTKKPDGWEFLGNVDSGYSDGQLAGAFRVYRNDTTKEIVLAFKGSSTAGEWFDNITASGRNVINNVLTRAQTALSAIRINPDFLDYRIFTTGHSLGGAAAQTFALLNGLDSYFFDSLPVSNTVLAQKALDEGRTIAGVLENYRVNNQAIGVYYAGEIANDTYRTVQGQAYLDFNMTAVPSSTNALTGVGAVIGRWLLGPWGIPIGILAAKGNAHRMSILNKAMQGLTFDETTGIIRPASGSTTPPTMSEGTGVTPIASNPDGEITAVRLSDGRTAEQAVDGSLVVTTLNSSGDPVAIETFNTTELAPGSFDIKWERKEYDAGKLIRVSTVTQSGTGPVRYIDEVLIEGVMAELSSYEFDLNGDIEPASGPTQSDYATEQQEASAAFELLGVSPQDKANKLISFSAQLGTHGLELAETLSENAQGYVDETRARIEAFFRQNVGQALANSRSDFSNKYVLADASAFGATQFDFVAYDQYHDALEQAALDPEFSEIEPLLEDALEIVEIAGQTVVLNVERPSVNPFDFSGFDPDTVALPSAEVREGGITRFTLSLPYSAGEGGQRVAITLDDRAAPNVRLLAGGEEVLTQGGAYIVTVPHGDRELELALWGQIDLVAGDAGLLTISAALTDSAGTPTHLAHIEASSNLSVRSDSVFDGPPFNEPPGEQTDESHVFLLQGAGHHHIDLKGGNDTIWGSSREDRFLGGTGDDQLFGHWRAYFGANDADWLSGGPGNDQLLGHEGDDILEGDSGSDTVLGDVGDDFLFGGSKQDYASIFTVGGLDSTGDFVQGGAGKDLVVGSGGADALSGGNDVDLILGGAGNDEIRGDTEFVPTHLFNVFFTTFPPEQPLAGGADVLFGNAGNDKLLGETGADRIYGGEGSDTLIGGEEQDELYGGAGDDFLEGDADSLELLNHTDDFLHGGEGNDYLRGQGGSDTLIGDAGEDLLEGGGEADIYLFNRGDGVDTILDEGSNTIRFGPGIDMDDLELGLGSLLISIGDSGDAIRIENFNPDDVLGSYAIDSFEFFDGRRLSYAELIAPGFDLAGTEEDEAISGTNLTDRIRGGGGNDRLDGRAGADTLTGGPGDDVYVVDEPGDEIREAPDEGNDTVESSAVSYVLGPHLENLVLTQIEHSPGDESDEGEEGGQIVITGGISGTGNELDNQIFGNVLDNVLDGGAGDDFLAGDFGSDIYRFGRGSGADTITEFDDAPGNLDSIQFAPDLAPADVTISRGADDLILSIRNSADRLMLLNWFASDAEKVERASFADGTVWDAATLEAMATTGQNTAPNLAIAIPDQSAPEDTTFSFTLPGGTFVDADAGDTLAFSAALADGSALPTWLAFDAATLTFSGTPLNGHVGTLSVKVTATDTGGMSASDTFDVLVVNTNDAPVVLSAIADQAATEDSAFGFTVPANSFVDVDAGDSLTLAAALADGSAPPAWLSFDPASRTFSGTPGNGDVGTLNVRVTATDTADATASDEFALEVVNVNDTPSLIAPLADQFGNQNAAISFQVPSVAFMDLDAGDTLTLSAAPTEGGALPAWLSFDSATGAFSGTPSELDVGDVNIRVSATDSAGATAAGTFTLSISDGSTVNETHVGTHRRDVIVTGFANDLIDAGRGDDLVHAGAGRDIAFGGRGEDLLYGEAGNDRLYGGKGGDQLYGGLGHDLLYGGRGGDELEGGEGADLLSGGAGHDLLTGGAGENLLIGGAGRDTITGGPGGDVFLVNLDDGRDELYLTGAALKGNQDVLSLGGGIGAGDISLKRDQGDLIVEARDADNHDERARVILKDWYRDAGDHQTVTTLQLFDGGTAVTYDFKGLVARFDSETEGRDPTRRWSTAHALPAVQLTAGASPLGGDIAREYAMSGAVLGNEPLADEDVAERAALPGGDWDPPLTLSAHEDSAGGSQRERDSGRDNRDFSKDKQESLADVLEAYLAQKPQYEFETFVQELEHSNRRGEVLSAEEIARRWQVVGHYGNGLLNENDDDARRGAVYRFNEQGLLENGVFGGGFGYTGSTGMARGIASLRALQGLEEGFQRLRS